MKLYPTAEDKKYTENLSDCRNIMPLIREKKQELADITGVRVDDITISMKV